VIVSSATLDAVLFRDFFELNPTEDESKNTSSIISVEGALLPSPDINVHLQAACIPSRFCTRKPRDRIT
jgi:hypothetical protein